MKTIITLLVALAPAASFAADYQSCKAQLAPIADAYAAYSSSQSQDCQNELNKPGAQRSTFTILRLCSSAASQLQPIKSRSAAACGQCKSVDAKIAQACEDDGLATFIERVRAL